MSSYVDNDSSTRPPMFDKDDFSGWKGRMSLFLESIDNNMPDILVDGPYVPTSTFVIDAVVREGQPTIPATVKSIVKDKTDWGDEDRRLANLDVKARNFIVQAVPKDIYHSIKMCSTAKKMWSTLTVMFEGCSTSMESTTTTLTRRYERFFSLRNESLTDTHTRFNALVNDLAAVGITKKTDVLKSKFLDSLPPKWNNYISSMKLSSVYQDLDLPGLFGLLHNQECSEAEKLIVVGDSYSQPASAIVASMTEHPSSISNEIIPCINESVPVISNTNSVCSESDVDESDGEDLANEVALLAERIRRRSFNKFKGKGRSGQADKTKKPFDVSKVTCYKCAQDQYKALKAQVAEPSKKVEKDEKSLIAKDWAESATSSDDEKYKDAKCFMAKEKFAEDLVKIQQQSELAHKASSSQTAPPEPPSPPKVQTKGENSKQIILVQKSGNGFNDPEKVGQTIAEAVSESDRSNNGESKRNKRKIRDHVVLKEKSKILKNKKSLSNGNVLPTESVSNPNHLKSDSDKIISKYVESRKGKISNDTNLLTSVSDSNIVDQSKLRSECKKSGIGKGLVQEETLNVARKNFKSGKGQVKQQWVSKCDKNIGSVSQSESDPVVSSGEPILRGVPK
uniref:uncharacterized protein LOC122587802 n=1 Tax=Erigeron canadensis TaxID=72917 RepID=UPI001CB9A34F|nr:uncharacterized protein LOC122587802 [Erigeron canadensis]